MNSSAQIGIDANGIDAEVQARKLRLTKAGVGWVKVGRFRSLQDISLELVLNEVKVAVEDSHKIIFAGNQVLLTIPGVPKSATRLLTDAFTNRKFSFVVRK
ncbi:MAG: hypothetical protein D6820_12070 [Lentisphaerae bacterium]|nr:MAG: hypothetical protein D6820_12070 [Lentisphaerota bacterium]